MGLVRGAKQYELSNHLGKALVIVSDKMLRSSQDLNDKSKVNYQPHLITAQDYYPFGMLMPGRIYTSSDQDYKFGFNGMLEDNEVKGKGNSIDFGARIYDSRIAKFLSVDPLSASYSWYTPYQFAGNNPIFFIDRNGESPDKIDIQKETGEVVITKETGDDVVRLVDKNSKILNSFTYGKNGSFSKEVKVNRGQCETFLVSNMMEKMQKIYNIGAKSDVEFAKTDVQMNNLNVSVIATSHEESTNTAQPGIVVKLANAGFKGTKISHNHPGIEPVPSGHYGVEQGNPLSLAPIRLGEVGREDGDAENARIIRSWPGWEDTKFEVLTNGGKTKTTYDGKNNATIEKNETNGAIE